MFARYPAADAPHGPGDITDGKRVVQRAGCLKRLDKRIPLSLDDLAVDFVVAMERFVKKCVRKEGSTADRSLSSRNVLEIPTEPSVHP